MCIFEDLRDVGSLATTTISGFGLYTKICVRNFKFTLAFPIMKHIEEVLDNHDELDQSSLK